MRQLTEKGYVFASTFSMYEHMNKSKLIKKYRTKNILDIFFQPFEKFNLKGFGEILEKLKSLIKPKNPDSSLVLLPWGAALFCSMDDYFSNPPLCRG
jgi:hypothetical protein